MDRIKGGGVYAYRCNKPTAIWGLPIIGRHWAYGGMSWSFEIRHGEHIEGKGRYNKGPKPWADLNPKCYRVRLPNWRWLRNHAETLLILLLWPVYNHQKNLWNPRRISLPMQYFQRRTRDACNRHRWLKLIAWVVTVRPHHILYVAVMAILIGAWAR